MPHTPRPSSFAFSTPMAKPRSSACACLPGPAPSFTAISKASRPGSATAFRAYGPYAPKEGHRFNPAKLLADPYALMLDRPFAFSPVLLDYRLDAPAGDFLPEGTDSAPFMPKAIAAAPAPAAKRRRARKALGRYRHLRAACARLHHAAPAGAGSPSRHVRGARPSGRHRASGEAWRNLRRDHARRGLDRRAASPRGGAHELLGLQSRDADGPRPAAGAGRLGGGRGERWRAAGRRHRGHRGRGAQPHRRGRPVRPHAVAARARQRVLLPADAARSARARERYGMRQHAGARPAARGAACDGRATGLGDVRRRGRLPFRPRHDDGPARGRLRCRPRRC